MRPPAQERCRSRRTAAAAFTLIELLVAIGLIGVLSGIFAVGLAGGGKAAALEAGQAGIINLLAAARTRAVAAGHPTRILVQHDAQSPLAGDRFLREFALEQQMPDGSWRTLQRANLPPGVYVLPHQSRTPANLFGGSLPWLKPDGTRLHSSCLSPVPVSRAIDADTVEQWVALQFTPQGTTGNSGFLVVAAGRPRSPGGYAAGESPVVLENAAAVRGLQLSGYGLAIPINDRAGF